ncbi:AfsR/SARP family transcriptional regulator [Longispora sp. K20-0274]|uniref:AfsR/SARP family transcriptional regulator n=1 Tax=Longispora sp. K20-0274 TaxID=3088255 RepID=UPI00399A1B80
MVMAMDGQPPSTLAQRHRAVLGYLLLKARRVVFAERLIGAVWGGTPPETARTQVQMSISVIRWAFRVADAPEFLVSRSAGYELTPEPGSLDAVAYVTASGREGSPSPPAARRSAGSPRHGTPPRPPWRPRAPAATGGWKAES